MSDETRSPEFEEWLSAQVSHGVFMGGYTFEEEAGAWAAWQASRGVACPGHGRPECATCCWPAPGYTAVDMTTAAADGYRDGKANFVMPETKYEPNGVGEYNYDDGYAIGWNECLEAIKELNK